MVEIDSLEIGTPVMSEVERLLSCRFAFVCDERFVSVLKREG